MTGTLEKLVMAQREIADLRRQLQDEHARYEAMLNQAQDAEARYVEAQQARERAEQTLREETKAQDEILTTLHKQFSDFESKRAAANALLRRAQVKVYCHSIFGPCGVCEDCKLTAAITAHLKDPEQKTAQEWIKHRFSRACPDELIRPRLVVIGPAEKLESIRLSVDNPAIPNQSGVRAWIEQ